MILAYFSYSYSSYGQLGKLPNPLTLWLARDTPSSHPEWNRQGHCFSAPLDWWCSTLVVSHWARTSDSCRSHKSRLIHRQRLYTPEWLLHSVKQRASLLMLVSSHETTGWPGNKSSTRRKTYEIDITLTLGVTIVTLTQPQLDLQPKHATLCIPVQQFTSCPLNPWRVRLLASKNWPKKQPQILLDPSRKRLPSRNHGTDRQTPGAAREGTTGTTEGTTGDSRYGRKASGGLQAMAQNLGSVSCSFFQFIDTNMIKYDQICIVWSVVITVYCTYSLVTM